MEHAVIPIRKVITLNSALEGVRLMQDWEEQDRILRDKILNQARKLVALDSAVELKRVKQMKLSQRASIRNKQAEIWELINQIDRETEALELACTERRVWGSKRPR